MADLECPDCEGRGHNICECYDGMIKSDPDCFDCEGYGDVDCELCGGMGDIPDASPIFEEFDE